MTISGGVSIALWIKYLLCTSKSVLSLGLNLFMGSGFSSALGKILKYEREECRDAGLTAWVLLRKTQDRFWSCLCSGSSYCWSSLHQTLVIQFCMLCFNTVFPQSGMPFPSPTSTSTMKPFLVSCSSALSLPNNHCSASPLIYTSFIVFIALYNFSYVSSVFTLSYLHLQNLAQGRHLGDTYLLKS